MGLEASSRLELLGKQLQKNLQLAFHGSSEGLNSGPLSSGLTDFRQCLRLLSGGTATTCFWSMVGALPFWEQGRDTTDLELSVKMPCD